MPLELARAVSVRGAAEVLAADPTARFLAGGTILMRLVNANTGGLQRLVLSDGLGLDRIAIAAALPQAGRKLRNVRIAYGAMAPDPIRVPAVERVLEGCVLDDAAIAAAAEVAAEGCRPESDAFASGWYRRSIVAVHLKRL